MQAKAHLRNVRISPRKVSVVLDLVRGEKTGRARAILRYTNKAASKHLLELLNSVVANAENNKNMNVENLYICECFVCSGAVIKRMRPGPKGRSFRILKRTSHITMVLKEIEA
jgi:large subunit ribosomal protein L22